MSRQLATQAQQPAQLEHDGHHLHEDGRDLLRTHFADFMAARRLKTPGVPMPRQHICKVWTPEPDRFILNLNDEIPRLNT